MLLGFIFYLNPQIHAYRLRLRYSTANNTYYRDYDDTLDPKTTNVKPDWESVLYNFRGMKRYRDDIHDEVFMIIISLCRMIENNVIAFF